MFRSLHMKLVLVMLLLITSLMAAVGAFLMTSVASPFMAARIRSLCFMRCSFDAWDALFSFRYM